MDYHLHTTVSDGLMHPLELLAQCARVGLQKISITDHDATGAYTSEVLQETARLGIELTVGIELDVVDGPYELHQRRQRAEEELILINELLGPDSVRVEEALPPIVDTVMKPHIIRALLERGKFANYKDAKVWLKANVKTRATLYKPSIKEGIQLLHEAGGTAVLAHPGYYMHDYGINLAEYLERLAAWGLDGVETWYPYALHDPSLFTLAQQAALRDETVEIAARLKLLTTRGSDCHKVEDFDKVYGAALSQW